MPGKPQEFLVGNEDAPTDFPSMQTAFRDQVVKAADGERELVRRFFAGVEEARRGGLRDTLRIGHMDSELDTLSSFA
jgi:hypothetical protein